MPPARPASTRPVSTRIKQRMTCQSIHVGLNQGESTPTNLGQSGQWRADLAVNRLPRRKLLGYVVSRCVSDHVFAPTPGLRFGRINAHFVPTRRQALCEPPASSSARWQGSSQWFIAISGFARISKLFKEPIVGKGLARDATTTICCRRLSTFQPKTIARRPLTQRIRLNPPADGVLTRDRYFQLKMAGAQRH
jgi:hypothetical protein